MKLKKISRYTVMVLIEGDQGKFESERRYTLLKLETLTIYTLIELYIKIINGKIKVSRIK